MDLFSLKGAISTAEEKVLKCVLVFGPLLQDTIIHEAQLMCDLRHPNVLSMLACFVEVSQFAQLACSAFASLGAHNNIGQMDTKTSHW